MLVKNEDQTKMEEGEYFAIETFGSTGRGRVVESVSHDRYIPIHLPTLPAYREKFLTMPGLLTRPALTCGKLPRPS